MRKMALLVLLALLPMTGWAQADSGSSQSTTHKSSTPRRARRRHPSNPRNREINDPIAKCADGTYSTSRTHRGACSHHGGVKVWLR